MSLALDPECRILEFMWSSQTSTTTVCFEETDGETTILRKKFGLLQDVAE